MFGLFYFSVNCISVYSTSSIVNSSLVQGFDCTYGLEILYYVCTQISPLRLAAEYGHYGTVKYLIDKGADVNITDKKKVSWYEICLKVKSIR